MNIDYLIVGSGLYGATLARLLTNAGYNCLILEGRDHIAGNIYTKRHNGYDVHVYGPHIFHTNNDDVIKFVNEYSEWNIYIQNTIATDGEKLYHLPFNMNTFYDIFNVKTPQAAKFLIDKEISENICNNPHNLEEYIINLVGKTVYEKLIKNYTEKQWGCKCTELSPDIIKRLPIRYNFDNNYFNDKFQGIPTKGYTNLIKNIIGNIPCLCGIEFLNEHYNYWYDHVKYKIIYCGAPDKFLDYSLGELQWRSLRFEDTVYKYDGYNGQGIPVLNDVSIKPYTRTIEHMWFTPNKVYEGIESIITTEYPEKWEIGKEMYYPINNDINNSKYEEYVKYIQRIMPKIHLGGRLGKYKYFDMDDTILEAMKDFKKLTNN